MCYTLYSSFNDNGFAPPNFKFLCVRWKKSFYFKVLFYGFWIMMKILYNEVTKFMWFLERERERETSTEPIHWQLDGHSLDGMVNFSSSVVRASPPTDASQAVPHFIFKSNWNKANRDQYDNFISPHTRHWIASLKWNSIIDESAGSSLIHTLQIC